MPDLRRLPVCQLLVALAGWPVDKPDGAVCSLLYVFVGKERIDIACHPASAGCAKT